MWADELIAIYDKPDINIIELALAKDKDSTITLLNKIAIDGEVSIASRIVLGFLEKKINAGEMSIEKLSKTLYFMSKNKFKPNEDVGNDMLFFWDGYDLAKSGVVETTCDQLEQEMRELLRANKA